MRFSINVSPASGKMPLLFLVAFLMDSTTASRLPLVSMGRIFQEKSPSICCLIQSSNSSQLHKKIFLSPIIFPPKNIFRRVKTTALQCPVGSTGFIAYVFFSGPLLDLPFLRVLIIVNCPLVKVDALVKSLWINACLINSMLDTGLRQKHFFHFLCIGTFFIVD